MLHAEEQLRIIGSGAAGIVPRSDLLKKLSEGRALRIKLGVDPTAPDLHLGHAVPLRKLRQFQDLGHHVVLIIGDFTALVGDPSGRSSTRPALSVKEIDRNAQTYIDQAFKILDPERTEMRRNSEWLGTLDFEAILRLAGQFTVARILERDDFSKRYAAQQSIALHELLYPVMQAYDSVCIQADVELGGTDQLFNLLAGRELMEKQGMEPQVCLTLPLLEGTDGIQKMSKSYGNYVGLTEDPTEMFGKTMSIPDGLMVKFYRLATSLPVDEVDSLARQLADGVLHPNEAKRRLAREIVAVYHDLDAARAAEEAFDRVFKRHEAPADIPVAALSGTEEYVTATGEVYLPGFFTAFDVTASASDARRQIDQGAVRRDGEVQAAGTYSVGWEDFVNHDWQVGKRRWIRPQQES